MNFPYFIARRVAVSRAQDGQRSFSRIIIRIAVVAVALSVAVMILTTALIRGFKNEIRSKMFGFFGHIHITSVDAIGEAGLLDDSPIDINQDFYRTIDTVESVQYMDQYLLFGIPVGEVFRTRTNGGIQSIQSFAYKSGIIQTKENIEGITLKGINTDFNWTFLKQYLVRGDTIDLTQDRISRQILISEQTANRIQVDTGGSFIVNFVEGRNLTKRKFEVAGIYKTGLEEYDRNFALVDIRQVQRLLKWKENEVAGFEVFVDDLDDLFSITEYLYLERIPSNLYAESIREKFPAIFEWLELQNINEQVLLGLMIIVSIINMTTALLILILERTNMIGILKALGASDWSIRKMFLYYAAYIVGVGLFWGNLIGIGLGLLQKKFQFIQLSESDYYLSYAPVEFNVWTILLLNVGSLILILLFLIIPSYLVTRIKPVKAIRFN